MTEMTLKLQKQHFDMGSETPLFAILGDVVTAVKNYWTNSFSGIRSEKETQPSDFLRKVLKSHG